MGSLYRKIKLIGANATNKLIAPVANALYSWLLIRDQGIEFWGEFVLPLLIANLSYQVTAWGHRDYLLKCFSEKPTIIGSLWTSNLLARLPVLAISILIFLVASPFSSSINLWMVVWMTAIYWSKAFNVVILFEKKFSVSSWLEALTALFVGCLLFIFGSEISLTQLIMLMGLSVLLKSLFLSLYFRSYFSTAASWLTGFQSVKASFGFFLPAVTGFLQNRIDIYLVALLMPVEALGIYQILMNLMAITHSSFGIALGPFIKNIYRAADETFRKVNYLMTIYGTLLCAIATGFMYLIINYYYELTVDTIIFGLVLLQLIPLANYQLKIYRLFKLNKPYSIVWINLSLVLIYLPSTLLLIPAYGLTGALLGNVINQWVALVAIHFTCKYYFEKSTLAQNS